MTNDEMDALRDYYDNTSLAANIAEAELNTETVQSPMIGITVRLPAQLLEKVRQSAAGQGLKTTALIRRWIEAAVESEAEQPIPAAADKRYRPVQYLEVYRATSPNFDQIYRHSGLAARGQQD